MFAAVAHQPNPEAQLRIRADFDVLIVVAGMDGALPSVVTGLVEQPVIACPGEVTVECDQHIGPDPLMGDAFEYRLDFQANPGINPPTAKVAGSPTS